MTWGQLDICWRLATQARNYPVYAVTRDMGAWAAYTPLTEVLYVSR